MKQFFIELWQDIWYGLLKHRPTIDFSEMPDIIRFRSHYDAEHQVHWIEAIDLPEFVVSGKTPQELANNMTETLLVYFDVPTYFAKRFKPQTTLSFVNQKTKKQETIRLHYREQLSKALA